MSEHGTVYRSIIWMWRY